MKNNAFFDFSHFIGRLSHVYRPVEFSAESNRAVVEFEAAFAQVRGRQILKMNPESQYLSRKSEDPRDSGLECRSLAQVQLRLFANRNYRRHFQRRFHLDSNRRLGAGLQIRGPVEPA